MTGLKVLTSVDDRSETLDSSGEWNDESADEATDEGALETLSLAASPTSSDLSCAKGHLRPDGQP